MFRPRVRSARWVLIPFLYLVVDLLAHGKLVLPAAPYWAHSQIQGEARAYHYPVLCFISDSLRSGNLPLWNPYQEGGFPLYCDPRSQLWFPVAWLLSLTLGYSFAVVQGQLWATFAAAGCAGYSYGRELRLGRVAAFALGAGYMTSGIFLGGGSDLAAATSLALFPFALALNHRAVALNRTRPAVGAGLILALAGLGGRPSIMAASLLNLILYNILLEWTSGPPSSSARWRRLAALTVLPMVVYLGVCAIQWLPIVWRSPQIVGGPMPAAAAAAGSAQFADFSTLMTPGQAPAFETRADGASSPEAGSRSLWVSTSLLIAATLAWTRRTRGALATSMFCWASLNVLLSLGGGLFAFAILREGASAFSFFDRPASNFRGFTLLALCVLGSLGVDNLLRLPSHRVRLWIRPVVSAFAAFAGASLVLLTVLSSWALLRGLGAAEWRSLDDLWAGIILALASASVFFLGALRRLPRRLMGPLFAAAVVVESSAQAWRSSDILAEPLTAANASEAEQLEAQRAQASPATLASLASERVAGAEDGKDPNLAWLQKSPAASSHVSSRLLRYAILAQLSPDPARMAELFSVDGSSPRVALVSELEIAGSADDAFRRLAARIQGRTRKPVVEAPPNEAYDWERKMASPPGRDLPKNRSARIDLYEPCHVEIHIETPAHTLVVFNDAAFPDWAAYLDDAPIKSWIANGLFRAVFVPPGPHRLSYVFRPWPVLWGAAISLISLVFAMGALRGPLRRNSLKFSLTLSDSP